MKEMRRMSPPHRAREREVFRDGHEVGQAVEELPRGEIDDAVLPRGVRVVTDALSAIRAGLPPVSGRTVVTSLAPPHHAPAQPVPPPLPARLPFAYEKSSEQMPPPQARPG